MKEFIVDLLPIGGGFRTKIRVFAATESGAVVIAKQMNPNYRIGRAKRAN